MESHLQVNLVRPSLSHKWGLQLSYDYTRKVIKVAAVVDNSILRDQLRVNDVLVKLNGVNPTIKFRDVKGLYFFMSKALNMSLTIKRPFSNEGKDKLPIDAATVELSHVFSRRFSSTPNSSSSTRCIKRKRKNDIDGFDNDNNNNYDNEIVEISTSGNNVTKRKSLDITNENNVFDTGNVDEDDDVKFIGGDVDTALFNMPHHREHCPIYSFQLYNYQDEDILRKIENNKNICKYCYCHICQIKASECPQWTKHCLHSLKNICTAAVNSIGGPESDTTGISETTVVDITSIR